MSLQALQSLDAQPYWDGLAETGADGQPAGRLLVQRCRSCGKHRHYPRPLCPACHSFKVDWVPPSGVGQVHSWTTVHRSALPAYAGHEPFTLLTVDLPEGVRLMGRLVDPAEGLAPGRPVRVAVERGPDGVPQPVFHWA